MDVYGFHGKSGTGKSFHAMNLCKDLDVEAIIDDGLFIYENRVLAGISAKRQKTKIKAIKTALFSEDSHRDEVAEKIRDTNPALILVIGTSQRMVEKIVDRLRLPSVSKWILIEDVTTESQREAAEKQRKELGKHVIPVPTFQIKHQFSGYFMDPLRMLRNLGGKPSYAEKTVVRPTYSYLGEYDLSERVIMDIVGYVGESTPSVNTVFRVQTESNSDGVIIRVMVLMEYGVQIVEAAKELQARIKEQVEIMTALHIIGVEIDIRGLS